MKERCIILAGSGMGFAKSVIHHIDHEIAERLVLVDLEKEADKKQIEPFLTQESFAIKPYPPDMLEPYLFEPLPKHKKRNGGNNRKGHKRKKAINGKRKKK